ncbi:EAL domain-containing protein [Halomonas cerina]|uniref:Diguanylate cyclase (GGDEF)-like protein n=1 Tax=Halomonas cerina TaxID=447424 RepID=A0A839V5B9_9GAMM|nr:EAL domain-containing protein [Halomonas cerina]MBB3188965.1 diguanylate cyclase (GGDEF)-like protein [Halomonas cerina]
MSLIKQLWLAIGGLVLVTLAGSLVISVITLRAALEQDLRPSNADAAGAPQETVPGWFVDLVRLENPTGRAEIALDGSTPPQVRLEPHLAYHALWQTTLAIGVWCLLAGMLGLIVTWRIVHGLRRPLRAVVEQARDIGHRRFTISRTPRLRELHEVVQALNQLSRGMSDILGEEHRKLDMLRRHLQHDRLTGVMNREAFLGQLRGLLESRDFRASGTLALVRIDRLAETNERLGHAPTDALLKQLARELEQCGKVHDGGLVGRLKGCDFALLLPGATDMDAIRQALSQRLERLQHRIAPGVTLPTAMIAYHQGDTPGDLLASLDGALASAAQDGEPGPVIVEDTHREPLFADHASWRRALEQAIAEGVYLAHYPVLDAHGKLLHFECPARLRLGNAWQPAGRFMPWVSRLGMDAALDLAVTVTALKDIDQRRQPIAINLSIASIQDARFVLELRRCLAAHPEAARQLWVELPEALATQDMPGFHSLCRELRPLGCRLGLEHVGTRFTHITDLHDLGLAYLKIDASLVRGVETSPERQAILRGMATLGHSLDLLVIGEGVETLEDARVLFTLGIDAATGPGIRRGDWPDA